MIPKAGDTLYVTRGFSTLAGVDYERGDTLQLIEPTGQTAFGRMSPLGNFVVRCKHFRPPQPQSIWSGIWLLLETGWVSAEKP